MPPSNVDETDPLLQDHRSEPPGQCLPPKDPTISWTKISRGTLIWILVGIWSPVFLSALDTTIVATLISPIGSYFRQSHKATYLGTSYLLSACCFTPIYGRLSDILGRKGAMLLALTLFTSGTLFCGISQSMDALIFARAVAGMGGGGIMTISTIVTTDLIPLKQRGLYHGLSSILYGLGAGLGGTLGGWVSDTIGWRWAFNLQVPFLVISMVLVTIKVNIQLPYEVRVQSTYEKLRSIDWLGSLTLVCAVGCFLLGVSLKTAEDIPWSNPLIWGLLMSGSVSLVIFVAVETFWSVAPVMPMRLLIKRTPLAVAITNLLISMTAFMAIYDVPLYFSAVRLTSSSNAGAHLLPRSVALPLGSVFAGLVMPCTGKFYYLSLVSAFLTVITGVLLVTWNDRTPAFDLWFDIVLNGFGGSSLTTTSLIALIASVAREDTAVATGISFLFRMSGQALGVTLSGALVQAVLLNQLRVRITGPGSHEAGPTISQTLHPLTQSSSQVIQRIRHEVEIIPSLDPPLQNAAVDSYAAALRAAFVFQACMAICTFLACLPIQENPLPDSHEEQREEGR